MWLISKGEHEKQGGVEVVTRQGEKLGEDLARRRNGKNVGS